jgi:histidine kinase
MLLEGYEIRETLAQSPSSLVCRALRQRDGRAVVIKSLAREYPSPREVGRLELEHRVLQQLDHPSVIRALALERDQDRSALVLEDFGGLDLPSQLSGEMPLDLFFTIALPLARALGHIHAQNIIHKDVKPHNVVLNRASGVVKLIDFNISSELSLEHQDATLPDQLEGSMPYISPEQTGRMNRELDYRSDYYSLGVTFFELLTGTLPFQATDPLSWVHCHISKRAPSPRELRPALPEPLARLVCRLMAKNPDQRYQSARGLRKDLEHCQRAWSERGDIPDFAIGEHDVSERFQLPQQLFGREPEIARLLQAFESASVGPARLLLVTGQAGVGKSSLIQELHRAIVSRRGSFIAGKFDQLKRDVPYGALGDAVRGLIKQLLAEPEARLRDWRARIAAALGASGQVLVNLIPELGQIIGAQPAVMELGAREGQARLQRVFRDLIGALAQPDHPLVIFIDDLQWTDASTPDLLVHLLRDRQLRHLLVIGAYRDNVVTEGHPLHTARRDLEAQRADAVEEIVLQPLSVEGVDQLVAATLHSEAGAARPLAELVFQKTAGNPFFVNELLGLAHREGAFQFVAAEGRWSWDHAKLARAGVSDNVVELVVQKLRRLPAATIDCLRLAACIGNRFDLQTLARVAGQPAGAVAAALRQAVQQRVLVPLGDGYRLIRDDGVYDDAGLDQLGVRYQFQHDRVQQAAYSLIDGDERVRAHLALGRRLRGAAGRGQQDDEIFEVVNHLNLGRALIDDAGERIDLARLNQLAGERAKRSAAYAIAAGYLETSLALLTPAEWAGQGRRHFECNRLRVECVFLAGGVELAGQQCDELIGSAPDRLSAAAGFQLKALILDHQGRLLQAVGAIRGGLSLLDVDLPADHGEIDRKIGEGIGKMQAHLHRVPIEDFVRLPEMTDPEQIMMMNLLLQAVPPAIQVYPPIFVLAELMMFDLALTHGTTAVSCKNFVDCGIIQGGILGDFAGAYRLGKVAFALLERYAPTHLESSVNFVFANFVSHWRAPYQEGFEAFARARRTGVEVGDVQHAAYAHALGVHRLLSVGAVSLDECHAETERSVAYLKQIQAVGQLVGASVAQRALAQLRGSSTDARFSRQSEEDFTRGIVETHNAQWLFLYGQSQAMVSCILGDHAAVERWGAFTAPYAPAGGSLFCMPDHCLFQTLAMARRHGAAPPAERAAILTALGDNRQRLKIWAENSPHNFDHKYQLAAAEIARVSGAPIEEVIRLYDAALTAAGEAFLQFRALINELQAEFWIERGWRKIARTFLQEAYHLYERWGAHRKLAQLERQYAGWLNHQAGSAGFITQTLSRDTVAGGLLDLASVIKATQAISGEVKPDRLFAKLMATIIENAGAQRGCLILEGEAGGQLYVEAGASVSEEPQQVKRPVAIESYGQLCPEIVRYVARTSDTVVVDDAGQLAAYRDDPYVRANGVKSVLCVPVLNQGKLLAILYAENNAVTHAFTPARLSLLQVIASQAAISITNARLYDKLEEKVGERTRELGTKNRQVEAMLNSIQQGIFTIDEDLVIAPQYSQHLEEILGLRAIAGRDGLRTLFDGSDVSADALDRMRAALQFSFGVPTFLAEANAGNLVRQFSRPASGTGGARFFEIDWHPIAHEDGAVGAILVALRDVTTLKRLNDIVSERGRELDIVGQVLEAGLDAFHQFCRSARAHLRENSDALGLGQPLDGPTRERLFRNVHTVKGNARLLGFNEMVDTIHRAEELFDAGRENGPSVSSSVAPPAAPADHGQLIAQIDAVSRAIDDYADVCARKLGETASGHDAHLRQRLAEIEALIREAAAGAINPTQAWRSLASAVGRAHAVPLRELVKETARMLPSLARELHKPAPTVEHASQELLLTPAWAEVMKDALVHVFRNALDHGLEPGDARLAAGKPAPGRITIHIEPGQSGGAIIRLADDGRGLALDSLRRQSARADSSDDELADLAFVSGVSTATRLSAISGRGVGLDAVRSFVRKLGGDVRIRFTGERRGGARPFELVFDLPRDAVLAPDRPDEEPARLAAAG